MHVVQVDGVDAEPLERCLARLAYVGCAAAYLAACGFARKPHDAELRRDCDCVAPAIDGLPDELFVGERSVHVGGVEERDAEVERAVDRCGRLGVIPGAVEIAHAHAAETLSGNGEAGASE